MDLIWIEIGVFKNKRNAGGPASGLFCQFLSAQEVGVNLPGKDGGAFLLTGQLASLFALDFYSTSFLFR